MSDGHKKAISLGPYVQPASLWTTDMIWLTVTAGLVLLAHSLTVSTPGRQLIYWPAGFFIPCLIFCRNKKDALFHPAWLLGGLVLCFFGPPGPSFRLPFTAGLISGILYFRPGPFGGPIRPAWLAGAILGAVFALYFSYSLSFSFWGLWHLMALIPALVYLAFSDRRALMATLGAALAWSSGWLMAGGQGAWPGALGAAFFIALYFIRYFLTDLDGKWSGPAFLAIIGLAGGLLYGASGILLWSFIWLAFCGLVLWARRRAMVNKCRGAGAAPPPDNPGLLAVIRCRHQGQAAQAAGYNGLKGCGAASRVAGSLLDCQWGCLGQGDCAAICPHKAIRVVNGHARIDGELCRGCGWCTTICPQNLLELINRNHRGYIACGHRSPLKRAADSCPEGCLGCGRCLKACPAGAIEKSGGQFGGAPKINQLACLEGRANCALECISACQRKILY